MTFAQTILDVPKTASSKRAAESSTAKVVIPLQKMARYRYRLVCFDVKVAPAPRRGGDYSVEVLKGQATPDADEIGAGVAWRYRTPCAKPQTRWGGTQPGVVRSKRNDALTEARLPSVRHHPTD